MKKYGLQLRAPPSQQKQQQQQKTLAPPPSAFLDDDEDDVEREIARQASKKKALKDIESQHKKALEEDPSVFDYDGVYDDMKAKIARPLMQDRQERKPKYIQKLVDKAKERAIEHEIIYERKLVKERQKDDHLFADKEKFVTSAYKKKLAETQKWLEEERLRQLREGRDDIKDDDCAKLATSIKFWQILYNMAMESDRYHNSPFLGSSVLAGHTPVLGLLGVVSNTIQVPPTTRYNLTIISSKRCIISSLRFRNGSVSSEDAEVQEGWIVISHIARVTKKKDLSDFYFNLSKNVAFGGKQAEARGGTKQEEGEVVDKSLEEGIPAAEMPQPPLMDEGGRNQDAAADSSQKHSENSLQKHSESLNEPSTSQQEHATSEKPVLDEASTEARHKRNEDAVAAAKERYLARKRARQ
ncbi:hypothetical protein ACLOJK_020816 [Asimina triloba]